MLCPYRTNQRVTRKYKDFSGNNMFFDIESTFAPCDRDLCPYFMAAEDLGKHGQDQCKKVWAETQDVTERVLAFLSEDDDGDVAQWQDAQD